MIYKESYNNTLNLISMVEKMLIENNEASTHHEARELAIKLIEDIS